jgi:hypothetical protein
VWHFTVRQIVLYSYYDGLTKGMFQIQKISAHIQLLENRLSKLEQHKAQVIGAFDPDPSRVTFAERDRVVEIDRQIERMVNSIAQYQSKLDKFNSLS